MDSSHVSLFISEQKTDKWTSRVPTMDFPFKTSRTHSWFLFLHVSSKPLVKKTKTDEQILQLSPWPSGISVPQFIRIKIYTAKACFIAEIIWFGVLSFSIWTVCIAQLSHCPHVCDIRRKCFFLFLSLEGKLNWHSLTWLAPSLSSSSNMGQHKALLECE